MSFDVASGAERAAILKRLFYYNSPGGIGFLFQLGAKADRPLAVKRAQSWPALSRSEALIAAASTPPGH